MIVKILMKRPFASPEQPHLEVDLLSAYIDRQVTTAERARVESHLSTCAACRADLESLRRTTLLVAALPRVSVPRAFTLSEAQVGRRSRAARPSWYGGLLRGLGAVTALALVAVVTATLISQPGWTPGGMVAQQAPGQTATATLSPAEEPPAALARQAEAPEGASAAATIVEAPAEPSAEEPAAKAAAPAATSADAAAASEPAEEPAPKVAPEVAPFAATEAGTSEPDAAAEATAGAEAPAAAESEAAPAALAQESAPTDTATAEVQALESAPAEASPSGDQPTTGPEATEEGARIALAPGATEAPAAKAGAGGAFGRGGGEGLGGAAAAMPGQGVTPEPTPPAAPANQVLAANARLAYTDYKSVWAIDRSSGPKKLLDTKMATMPVISPDGAWVAYRDAHEGASEIWVVRWDGSNSRRLLDEGMLPKDNLGTAYTGRVLQNFRWIPRQAALAVSLVAVPVEGGLPRIELWRLDVATGSLTYVTDMGRAQEPLYSPDGTRFALLEYGTDAQPQGTLTLLSADGRERRVALTFPAGPAKVMFTSQVKWLPNSRGLLVAIPTVEPTGPTALKDMNGATVYRVPVNGEVTTVGKVNAFMFYWSPDGTKLAYVRGVSDMGAGSVYELYLAAADGSAAQLYATLNEGMFINWSPDNSNFLYQNGFDVYVGQAGRKPQRLGNSVSVLDPRWASNRQVVSRHDLGSGWLLAVHGVDGSAYGLLTLPYEAEVDVVAR